MYSKIYFISLLKH